MARAFLLVLFLLASFFASSSASAQNASAVVVAACGTPPVAYTANRPFPLTIDTAGKLCTSGLAASSITVGSSPIVGGTTTRLLYDNAGVIGEKNLTVLNEWYVSKSGADTNPCTYDAMCLTIGHAIGLASAGSDIEIFKGNYAENLTLVAGVSLTCEESRGVFITGNTVAAYSGTTYLHSCDLQASSGSVLTISGANAVNLQIDDVHLDGLSGSSHTISYTNSNAASRFIADNGAATQAVSTSATVLNVATGSAGSIQFEDVAVTIIDNPDHVAIAVGGAVSMTHNMDQVQGQVTVADTAVYNGVNLKMITATVPSLVTNSTNPTTPSSLTQVLHYTSAHPLVTGAGLFAQGLNVFAGTGYDFATTLSGGAGALPLPGSPFTIHAATLAPAAGLAAGYYDGTIEHDASHLYADLVTIRYQLDQQLLAGAAPTAAGSGGTCATGAIAGNKQTGTITLTGACVATNTITLTFTGAAPVGFACQFTDRNTPASLVNQTSVTSTTVSVATVSGTTTATDVIQYQCSPY